jgi:phosphatidylglycerophosphatase A
MMPMGWSIASLVGLFMLGWYVATVAGRTLGDSDHPAIVIDEIWAMAALLAVTPATPRHWLAAFVLFRGFDIVKPWPIGVIDRRLRGGLGAMADDALAAVYAGIVLLTAEAALNRLA